MEALKAVELFSSLRYVYRFILPNLAWDSKLSLYFAHVGLRFKIIAIEWCCSGHNLMLDDITFFYSFFALKLIVIRLNTLQRDSKLNRENIWELFIWRTTYRKFLQIQEKCTYLICFVVKIKNEHDKKNIFS